MTAEPCLPAPDAALGTAGLMTEGGADSTAPGGGKSGLSRGGRIIPGGGPGGSGTMGRCPRGKGPRGKGGGMLGGRPGGGRGGMPRGNPDGIPGGRPGGGPGGSIRIIGRCEKFGGGIICKGRGCRGNPGGGPGGAKPG